MSVLSYLKAFGTPSISMRWSLKGWSVVGLQMSSSLTQNGKYFSFFLLAPYDRSLRSCLIEFDSRPGSGCEESRAFKPQYSTGLLRDSVGGSQALRLFLAPPEE